MKPPTTITFFWFVPFLFAAALLVPVAARKNGGGVAKIVGGSRARGSAYPWYACSIETRYLCGASLIADNILLTAAHCARAFAPGGLVRVGSDSQNIRAVVANEVHPQYDAVQFHNDVMVVLLDEPVRGVTPIRLNERSSIPSVKQRLKTMGYGSEKRGGQSTSSLMDVDLYAMDTATCYDSYINVQVSDRSRAVVDGDIMFCAGSPARDGFGTCEGDSGGPLITSSGVQVGIVSSSAACGVASLPTLFTRVSTFIDWIDDAASVMRKL